MRNNIIRGNSDRLKISNITKVMVVPDICEIRAKKQSWKYKIKQPLENALLCLKEEGILTQYCYKTRVKNLIEEREADQLSYEEWSSLLLFYAIDCDFPQYKKMPETGVKASQKRYQCE